MLSGDSLSCVEFIPLYLMLLSLNYVSIYERLSWVQISWFIHIHWKASLLQHCFKAFSWCRTYRLYLSRSHSVTTISSYFCQWRWMKTIFQIHNNFRFIYCISQPHWWNTILTSFLDDVSADSSAEFPDRTSMMEVRLQAQEDEITLLKSSLADALRRIRLHDQLLPVLKQQLIAGGWSTCCATLMIEHSPVIVTVAFSHM